MDRTPADSNSCSYLQSPSGQLKAKKRAVGATTAPSCSECMILVSTWGQPQLSSAWWCTAEPSDLHTYSKINIPRKYQYSLFFAFHHLTLHSQVMSFFKMSSDSRGHLWFGGSWFHFRLHVCQKFRRLQFTRNDQCVVRVFSVLPHAVISTKRF